MLWCLILAVAGTLCWAVLSDSPAALRLHGVLNRSHTEVVTPPSFAVEPRSFSFYKVTVPAGASHVAVNGPFNFSGGINQGIEVFLMSDAAFADWQDGYAGGTYYRSGRVAQGVVDAALPATAGTYYLVFNNKASMRAGGTVEANVTLHYERWWPLL